MVVRKLRIAAVMGAVALMTAACGSTASSSGRPADYKLGLMLPLTGPAATIGQQFRDGAELAVKEINDAGGIGGAKVQLEIEDTAGKAEGGVAAMNKLVNLKKVPFVMTALSGPTLAAQPVAAQTKTVLLNVGGVSSDLLNRPYLYNNAVNLKLLGPLLAERLYKDGYRKVAFIGSADPFGTSTVDSMSPVFEKLGGQIVEKQTVDVTGTDYSAQLAKLRAAKPDVVVASATGEPLGRIVKQARDSGLNVPMAGPLATDGLLSAGGKAAEGFVDIGLILEDKASAANAKKFTDTYTAKYKKPASWIPGTAYETVHLYKELVEKSTSDGNANPNGEQLGKLITGTSFSDALVGGEVTFIADHSVSREVGFRVVKDGQFSVLDRVLAK